MPSILHISDLHRTSGPRLNNAELLSALLSDAERWESDGITRPELIVVSGDVIQGVSLNSEPSDSEIADQYGEANDFLCGLVTEFLGSDRSRLVVVPGNHDVDWHRARAAMQPLESCPSRVAQLALEADSGVRWDWDEQCAYEIVDTDLYESRYNRFRQFQDEFYAPLNQGPRVDNNRDIIFFDYPELNIAVVGFASWHGNDCFCHVGQIHVSDVAASRDLIANSSAQVALAVWHHSIVGGPRANDYMDPCVIHRLIDYGFNVGLHGHQHYPDAAPYTLSLPNLTSMAVIGAGSLAVGDDQLPMGEPRQFNILNINTVDSTITIHVRAMSTGGVFSAYYRADFGGSAHTRLDLPRSSRTIRTSTSAQLLDEALTAVHLGNFAHALSVLSDLDDEQEPHAVRQATIRALDGLGLHDELITLLSVPEYPDEVVHIIALLIERGEYERAERALRAASDLLDNSLYTSLAERIDVERLSS